MVAAGTASRAEAPAAAAAPPVPPDELRLPTPRAATGAQRAVRRTLLARGAKIAVVDDDPTGTQTVRDVPLLTRWTDAELTWAMEAAEPLFAILTNSRALPRARAVAVNAELGERLARVARRLGCELRVISRGDSTLRGHFPDEAEALAGGLAQAGERVDGVLVCPAFPEAGRVTARGVHWVRQGGRLVPAAETEYARDAAFGYASSELTAWVRERAGANATVAAIDLDDIRLGGPGRVAARLLEERGRARYVVADAVERSDLDVLAAGVSLAEERGLRVLCRTGPSFLSARAGRAPAVPLRADEVAAPGGRGLLVVGSHTALTTTQLEQAQARHPLALVTLDVEELLAADAGGRRRLVARAAGELGAALADGDAALVTSRRVAAAARGPASLETIAAVADALVGVVRAVAAEAAFDWLLAKGGITSHDVAVRALDTRRATVLGQLLPGQVSVWKLRESSRPGLRYVVFPGNVGDAATLAQALDRLRGVS